MRKLIVKKPCIPKGLSADGLLKLAESEGLAIDRLAFERTVGKTVFDMRMQGEIVPLWEVAAGLGLREGAFYGRKDIKTVKIGKDVFVTAAYAAQIKNEYLQKAEQEKLRKAQQEQLRQAKQLQKAEQLRKTKQEKLRKAEQEKAAKLQITKIKKPAANPETKRLINVWKNIMSGIKKGGRKAMMKKLLLRSVYLTPEQFKAQTEPLLKRMMER